MFEEDLAVVLPNELRVDEVPPGDLRALLSDVLRATGAEPWSNSHPRSPRTRRASGGTPGPVIKAAPPPLDRSTCDVRLCDASPLRTRRITEVTAQAGYSPPNSTPTLNPQP